MGRSETLYEKYDDTTELQRGKIVPSMFPPTPEEAEELHLERWYVRGFV
jgi:hypothetical protein